VGAKARILTNCAKVFSIQVDAARSAVVVTLGIGKQAVQPNVQLKWNAIRRTNANIIVPILQARTTEFHEISEPTTEA
jgi:hypothetical protein